MLKNDQGEGRDQAGCQVVRTEGGKTHIYEHIPCL